MLARITIAESRYLQPPVIETYQRKCKSTGEEPRVLQIKGPDGEIPACWLGSPDAEVVMLYLHGGGYTQPCAAPHMDFAHTLVKEFNGHEHSKSFAMLFLAYSLAPEATHPAPLKDAAAALLHIMNEGDKSPSNIIISGDSAGGGLVFSLLSHILHPHPQVPEIKLSKPLGGAVVYSPWVDFKTDHDSFDRNAHKDVLERRCLHVWSAMYTGNAASDPEADLGYCPGSNPYVDPASNDSTWWDGLHLVVDDMFIWAGANEVFVDGIAAFEKTLRAGWKLGGGEGQRLVYMEAPHEAHVEAIFNWKESTKDKGDSQIAIKEWLKERITK